MSNTVKTKKPKKLHKPMSMKLKVSITVAVLVIAVIVAVLSFGSGAMTFKPGAVQSHDDPVDVTESPVIGEDGAAIPQENRHTVLVSVGNGGSANPEGSVSVEDNGAITIGFTPDEGYEIKTVTVDGQDIGQKTSYTLSNIREDHTIMVTFEKIPEPSPSPEPTDGMLPDPAN